MYSTVLSTQLERDFVISRWKINSDEHLNDGLLFSLLRKLLMETMVESPHLAWTSQGDFFLTSRWKIYVPLAVFSDS
jgi:hypothetical protein